MRVEAEQRAQARPAALGGRKGGGEGGQERTWSCIILATACAREVAVSGSGKNNQGICNRRLICQWRGGGTCAWHAPPLRSRAKVCRAAGISSGSTRAPGPAWAAARDAKDDCKGKDQKTRNRCNQAKEEVLGGDASAPTRY
jgi:hypothetical protein